MLRTFLYNFIKFGCVFYFIIVDLSKKFQFYTFPQPNDCYYYYYSLQQTTRLSFSFTHHFFFYVATIYQAFQ